MRIEKTIGIARPVEEVWTLISDARNDPQWCGKVDAVEQTAGEGPGPQARYRARHQPVRLKPTKELAMTVEEYEAPRSLRLREEDDDAVFHVLYRLEGTPEGTSFTQSDEIEWKIPVPLRPIGWIMVSRDIQRQLSALKRLLEG